MKKHSKLLQWICLVFLLVCTVFVIVAIDFSPPTLYKKDIYINLKTDNYYKNFSNESVKDLAISFFNDLDSLNKDINTELLEEKILENKYIKKAEVYLSVEGKVNIYIYFRQPFLQVLENKKLYYYDDEAVRLPSLSNVDKNLLIVSGDVNGFLKRDLSIVNRIYEDDLLKDLIGGIHYNNEYILSSKLCDLKIKLGPKPLLNGERVEKIILFSNLLQQELGCDYCNSIDLQYDNQIICVK